LTLFGTRASNFNCVNATSKTPHRSAFCRSRKALTTGIFIGYSDLQSELSHGNGPVLSRPVREFASSYNTFVLFLIAYGIVMATPTASGDESFRSRFRRVHTAKGWHSERTVESSEGSGPFGIEFSVEWKNGEPGYTVTSHCGSEQVKESRSFKSGPIRFTDLRAYENPVNDYWEEHGQGHKRFPHSIFVGQAIESGWPVTFFWEANEVPDEFIPRQILKTFRASTRYLGGLAHGQSGPNGIFVERTRSTWLPPRDRPSQFHSDIRLERIWSYRKGKFVAGPWKVEK